MRFIKATPNTEETVLAGVDTFPVGDLITSLRLFMERGGFLANDEETVTANRHCLVCAGACVTRLLDEHDGDTDLEDTNDAEQDDDPAEDPDVDEDGDPKERDDEDSCSARDDAGTGGCGYSDGGPRDPEDAEYGEGDGFSNPMTGPGPYPTIAEQLRAATAEGPTHPVLGTYRRVRQGGAS